MTQEFKNLLTTNREEIIDTINEEIKNGVCTGSKLADVMNFIATNEELFNRQMHINRNQMFQLADAVIDMCKLFSKQAPLKLDSSIEDFFANKAEQAKRVHLGGFAPVL